MRFASVVPVVILGACVQPQGADLPPQSAAGEQLGSEPEPGAQSYPIPTSPSPKPRRRGCPPGMVSIPQGTFQMGSNTGEPNEKPVHEVTVSAYCMDVTEVTVEAYVECVQGGACTLEGINGSGYSWAEACNWGEDGRESHPINCVGWDQATAYCQWAGKRLPTEEEWEYGARGRSGRVYPWGSEEPGPRLLNACGSRCVAWEKEQGQTLKAVFTSDDGWARTSPVGRFPEGDSPFGLKDMAGNVWEWTSSGYSEDYGKNSATDRRVARGGSWRSTDPSYVRAACRLGAVPEIRTIDLGFRCAQ